MTKLLGVGALIAALMLLSATAVGAGNALRASLEGTTVGVITDPVAVAARCPAGYEAIVQSAGSGELLSEAYTGPVAFSTEHCARLLITPTERGHTVGKTDAGLGTLVTPAGDELSVAYQGTFVFNGELGVVWRTDGHQPYTITDGTGIFADASGHGQITVVDNSGNLTLDMNGSLRVAR